MRGKNRMRYNLFCAKEIFYIKLNTKEIEQSRMLDSITPSYLHLLPKKDKSMFWYKEVFTYIISYSLYYTSTYEIIY